ncbi:MAG TPA: hypothetical protein VEL75_23210 [Candidatus Methylomirabilis sp.]|nr:hypothetical protein [Candidatus Methylomirabilis sp.]
MARPAPGTGSDWKLSVGELHYVWWYIQGSIMEPDVRLRLRRAWGMCQRHAWGAVAAEASYRGGYLHGPAILYEDLLARALGAFDRAGSRRSPRILAWRLRDSGPCLMCEMGFHGSARGAFSRERSRAGRDPTAIRTIAAATRAHWITAVCGVCSGDCLPPRCRLHLLQELDGGASVDMACHRREVAELHSRLSAYARSFQWECRDTATDRDRAALLAAVGWCSGWEAGLALVGDVACPSVTNDGVERERCL